MDLRLCESMIQRRINTRTCPRALIVMRPRVALKQPLVGVSLSSKDDGSAIGGRITNLKI
jgi:hypothetical protein